MDRSDLTCLAAPNEMGAGIAASPQCAERRICRCSVYLDPAPVKVCDPASRSWLTSSGVASHLATPSEEEPGCSTRPRLPESFACLSFGPAWRWNLNPKTELPSKTTRCSTALLGIVCIASRFAHQISEEIREPRRTTGRLSLPAPLPAGPGKNPKALPIACRRRSVLWYPAAPSCRCRPSVEA